MKSESSTVQSNILKSQRLGMIVLLNSLSFLAFLFSRFVSYPSSLVSGTHFFLWRVACRLQDLETEGHANTGSVRGTGSSSSSKGSKIQPHVFGAPYRAGWLNASAPHLAICVSGTPKLLTLPK